MHAISDQIKRGRKYDQVIAGARQIFLHDGFEGASVDDIAKAAGVSKATLYSYFPDKRLLFLEVATAGCCRQAYDAVQEINGDRPPAEVLYAAAMDLMCFFLSDFGRAIYRVVVAESERFPELGREYWQNGPARARAVLIGYFQNAIDRGELVIADLDLAADQFLELCKVDLFPRLVMGLERDYSAADQKRIATGAVDMFLARYGT
ncbi:TetR/AcrR family transcriptional regulator [Tropicimonas isoalkanivorans]|uniref:Transcriptional regulator, TetR family n=1 Tax=Tropicimonas isoalkanivorans TaxID=441112 RepID=A0A1I1P4A2_9RHOB|nr:TetR/AcrR family transcriptional regulator [Tropicimonas isoalkanivorans]SFD01803.1 transcriptional regulator, TetR family [Tropicimonas isoalkanivorans]